MIRRVIAAVLLAGCGGATRKAEPIGNTTSSPGSAIGVARVDRDVFLDLIKTADWGRVIDPGRGFVEMSAVASAQDEAMNELWVSRRCGDRAVTVASVLGTAVHKRLIEAPEAYVVDCTANIDDTVVTCAQPGLGEYDLIYTFQFDRRPGGFVLAGISTVDVGTTAEEQMKNYEAELAKAAGC